MEPELQDLSALFPSVAAQLRNALSTLHLAAAQLAPPSEREEDPALDAKAALLDQSYYQLLRLVSNLSAAALLREDQPLLLKDVDVVDLVESLCRRAEGLAAPAGADAVLCLFDGAPYLRRGAPGVGAALLSPAVKRV